ncbi:MAG TPA: hypothetical protein ACFYEK_00670 [Candidatus Wunengus sp. YC60]|uniref:hypothetical protein n=1 Tax=Candidatus Wunengus sp. YC60 TaxID=3367697 RepID=UPI0040282882
MRKQLDDEELLYFYNKLYRKQKGEKLNNLLKQIGRLFLEVPNNENPKIREHMPTAYHYLFFAKNNLIDLFRNFKLNVIKISCFGKTQLLNALTKEELKQYEKTALDDDRFNDIIEMDEKERGAYWLRILVQKY